MLDKNELKDLIEPRDGICVSIVMPTNQVRLEAQMADQIRLRNLIDEAERQLAAFGWRYPDYKQLMEPATALLEQNGDFWKHTGNSMAIYLSQDAAHIYQLPLSVQERVVVGAHFYVMPLLPLLLENGRFYILTLSQKKVRLLAASKDSIREMDLVDIPQSLDEAMQWDDPKRQLQWHTSTGSATARGRAAAFHGHGIGTSEVRKADLQRFVQQVANGVGSLLAGKTEPLLLAGVDYLLAMYKEVNQYPALTEAMLVGSPDTLSWTALRQKGWELLQSIFQQEQVSAVERFERLAHTKYTSTYLREILTAAHAGRMETLLAIMEQPRWGRFDSQTGYIHLSETADPSNEDLHNLAAIYTLQNGGAVYSLPPNMMPNDALLAAVFRY